MGIRRLVSWGLFWVLSTQAQAIVAGKGEGRGSSRLTALLTGQKVVRSAPRLISGDALATFGGVGVGATVDDLLAAAQSFVDARPDLVGARWADLELVRDAVLVDDDLAFLDFDVRRDGILIEDANVAFRFKQGRLVQVQAETFPKATWPSSPALDANVDVAAAMLAGTEAVRGADVVRVDVSDGAARMVPVATYRALVDGEPVRMQIDLASGELFEARSMRHYDGEGQAVAKVYPRTWYRSSTVNVPIADATLTVGAGTLTTDGQGRFQAGVAPRLNGFKGPRVEVLPRTGVLATKAAVARGAGFELAFVDTSEKALSQAMAFHHVNLVVSQAKKYISAPWMDEPLYASVNLTQTCNAYWDSVSINFYSAGGGCANTALISDVIYHEWGHGLDDNTGGIADDAFSEGFGDIVAMIMARDPVTAPGFRTDGSGIRNLEPDKVYPRDRGEVHAEGLIIGGTFWDLYKSLVTRYDQATAVDLISKYAFKVIFTARRYTDVYAALKVIDDDDGDLANGTPHFCELNAAFARHGLATVDAECGRISGSAAL